MIDVAFFDIDGILTDGAIYVDSSGNETKRILFEDIDAIFALKRAGIKVGFITAENSKFCDYVRKRFEPDFFLSGCKEKLKGFIEIAEKNGLDVARVCYAGDSRKDMDLLKYLEFSFAPIDVDQKVKNSAKIILKAARGKGVVREVVEYVFEKNGNVTFV